MDDSFILDCFGAESDVTYKSYNQLAPLLIPSVAAYNENGNFTATQQIFSIKENTHDFFFKYNRVNIYFTVISVY